MRNNFKKFWISIHVGLMFSCSNLPSKGQSVPPLSYHGHGSESIAPEVLEKFAPKPLDSELMKKIQLMLDTRTTSLGLPSEDGKKLFVNWDVTGTSQVWKVPRPKGFPIQMTGGDDVTVLAGLLPNGKFLVLSRDRKGEENPGIYLQKVQGGELIKIFHEKKVQAFVEFVTDDSKFLYFRTNELDPGSYSIYRFHLDTGKRDLIFSGEGYWTVADFKKKKGNEYDLLLAKWKGNTSVEYFEWTPKGITPLFGQDEEEYYIAAYGPREKELIVLTNKFGEFNRLYRWKQEKKEGGHRENFQAITEDWPYETSSFYLDRKKEKIFLQVNQNGYTKISALNAKTYQKLKLPNFQGKGKINHIYFGATSKNGLFTTIGVETTKAPRMNYLYNWQTEKLQEWVDANSPETETSQFSEPELEYYPARDGTKIPMFVNRPKHCQNPQGNPCPVIVNFHGGPEAQSQPHFSSSVQLFVDQGFIYVQPNVRGSDGYGKSWLHADNGRKRLDVITDIEDCALFIKKSWAEKGKTPKVGVMGGSYGGYSTLVAMTLFAGSYEAGVANVGMSNLISFLNNTAAYRRHLRISEYGDPEKDQEALIKLSPINYLDKLKSPLLILHGANDPRVPAGEAIQIYQALEKKGVPAKLILFPDEGHGVRKRENRASSLGYTLEFFRKHLMNE